MINSQISHKRSETIKYWSNLSVNLAKFSYYVSCVSGCVNQILLMCANKTNRKVQKGPQREHLWHIIQLHSLTIEKKAKQINCAYYYTAVQFHKYHSKRK